MRHDQKRLRVVERDPWGMSRKEAEAEVSREDREEVARWYRENPRRAPACPHGRYGYCQEDGCDQPF